MKINPFCEANNCSATQEILVLLWRLKVHYHVYHLTVNSLLPWSWIFFGKLIIAQLLKKFPAFCGIRSFITVFTTALHKNPVHTFSSYLRSILIISSHIHLRMWIIQFLTSHILTLRMEVECSSATLVPSYKTVRCHDPEDNKIWKINAMKT
jgi:hypothetical protein